MIDFASRKYPFTGFGDDPRTSIKFMLIRGIREPQHSWSGGEPTINDFPIRHSSNIVTQVPNERAPREMTVRLWFPDVASLEALDAVQGSQATLRYAWGLTDRAGGYPETRGQRYLVLPDTLLVRLDNRITPRGRQPEAVATFRRPVGTSSVYGYALYSEDE